MSFKKKHKTSCTGIDHHKTFSYNLYAFSFAPAFFLLLEHFFSLHGDYITNIFFLQKAAITSMGQTDKIILVSLGIKQL